MPYPSVSLYPATSGLYPGETEGVPLTVSALRESPPDLAGLYLTAQDGSTISCRPDGDLALVDYSFTSEREGGFATLDASLVPEARDRHAIAKFQPAQLRADAGDTLWEGRVETPGEVSDSGQVDLSCIGLGVLMAETEFTFLGVSSDLALWGDPPRQRIEGLNASGESVNQSFQLSSGEDGIAITMDSDRNVQTTASGEAWWGKHGLIEVAEVQYMADEANNGGEMETEIRSFATPGGASSDDQTLDTTLAKTTFTVDPTTPYAMIHDTPIGGARNKPARSVTVYAAHVFGDHDLPRARLTDLPDGLWFSDVLRFLGLNEAGLSVTRYGIPTIERSSDPSPNLAWLETTSLAEVLDEGLGLEPQFAWQVWEGPTLWFRRRHQGARWDVRRADGASFESEGETAEEEFNVAIVVYENRDGRIKRAGPPGWDCDTEDIGLRNLDPNLSCNQQGIDKPLVIELGLATNDKAVEIGEIGLREAARQRWSGDVSLPRFAFRNGVWSPTFLLRADDVIVDGETGRELPVAAASYSRSSELPLTATIDTPANRLDAALAKHEARPRKVNRKRIKRRERRAAHKRRRQRRKERQD